MKARLLIIFAISLSFIIITLTLLSNTLGLIVQADTFTVTIFSDTNDGNCDADCSLREAVMAANNNPGPDTITLAAGTYVLTLGGDLDVTDALTITGVGPDRTVIDANGTSRIFNLTSEATSVTLSNMTLTGGVTSQPGGGISHSGNRLILSNTVVISNKVTSDFVAGGGIAVLGGASITLIGGQVVSNTTGGDGGGIYLGSGASLTQTGETIIGYNYAKHRAGGIWLGFSTKTVLDGAQIINNRSDASSGGIFIGDDSSLTMNGGKISENSAYFVGGGLGIQDAIVTLDATRILSNTIDATTSGGAIYYAGNNGQLFIANSCIKGNKHTSIYNASFSSITATNNWWRAEDGPSGVGPGSGDSVTDRVDFSNFLTLPPEQCANYVYLPVILRSS